MWNPTKKFLDATQSQTRARLTIRATENNFVTGFKNSIINKEIKFHSYHNLPSKSDILVTLELVDWVVGLLKIEELQLRPTLYVKLIFVLPINSYHCNRCNLNSNSIVFSSSVYSSSARLVGLLD